MHTLKLLNKLPKSRILCSYPLSSNQTPQNSEATNKTVQNYDNKTVTKEDLKWRTSWHKENKEYYTLLRAFSNEKSKTSLLKFLQTPIDFSPASIKRWWANALERRDLAMQGYIPQRHQTLGNELAAAHFLVYRGAAVKFHNESNWIKADKNKHYDLPRFYEEDKYLEAIDCNGMKLYYEGLVNLRGLKNVTWLSLNDCMLTDDWFLDKISHLFSYSLIYLDLRNCPNYTERGLGALQKMEKLKILYIDDMLMTTSFEMTCLMLQELNPQLDIRIGDD